MTEPALDERSIIQAHARTFHGFTLGVKWFCIHAGALIFGLCVAFAAGQGVIAGIICGLIVFGIGVWAMNHGLSHSTEQDSIPPAYRVGPPA